MTEEERKGKTVTEVGTDKSTESEPIRETEKTPYICSLCGAEVVPIEVQRSDGWISYRCPECGKFMKPLTPEDVKEKEEEGRGPLLPDDIAMTERVKELLAEELSTVYGIPQKQKSSTIRAILDTITQDTVRDPLILHNHVKYFAKNAALWNKSNDDTRARARIQSIRADLNTLSRVEARFESINTLLVYVSQGYEEALKVLLQCAEKDPQEKVRIRVLYRLPDYIQENPQICPTLVRIKENDPAIKVRAEAITCAARMGCAGYIDVSEIVESSMYPHVLRRALRVYLNKFDIQIDDEPSDYDAGLGGKALEFMALIGTHQSTVATIVFAAETLFKAVGRAEIVGRSFAHHEEGASLMKLRETLLDLLSIHPMTAEHIVDLFVKKLYPNPNKEPTVLHTLLEMTLKVRDSRLVEPLIDLTSSKIDSIREGAAMGLGHQGDPRALKALHSLSKDKSARAAAIIARAKVFDESLKREAGKGIKDKNIEVRTAYIEAVGIMQMAEYTDKLLDMVSRMGDIEKEIQKEQKKIVRDFDFRDQMRREEKYEKWRIEEDLARKAAEALGKIEDSLPVLIEKFNESFGSVRRLLAFTLGETRNPSVIPHLMKGVKDQEPEIKLACLYALSLIGGNVALNELLSLLKRTRHSETRVGIIEAIAQIGDGSVVDTLFELISANGDISRACVRALGKIAGVEAIDVLQSYLGDKSWGHGFKQETHKAMKEIRIRSRIQQVKGN